MKKPPPRLCLAAVCVVVIGLAGGAAADDVSRWDGDARSAVRLLAGSRAGGGDHLRAGVEIRLK